ncbi:hypothetical protein CEXT_810991 [Caerostris extrusa]|uniref:Uncharacterized protein n=1 Tax=Caerostris extrusa TaxID=172846 RepID=A0AAV4QJ38_CAEEX|nr:hypothetical protein CEXT_810991 [Caerostris extrusa]
MFAHMHQNHECIKTMNMNSSEFRCRTPACATNTNNRFGRGPVGCYGPKSGSSVYVLASAITASTHHAIHSVVGLHSFFSSKSQGRRKTINGVLHLYSGFLKKCIRQALLMFCFVY